MILVLLLQQAYIGLAGGGVPRPFLPSPSLLHGQGLYIRQRYTHPNASLLPTSIMDLFPL